MTDPRSLRGDLALGIDVGTSGVRTAVLGRDGNVVADSQALMSDFGSDHRDPASWRAALAAALADIWKFVSPDRIGAIAVDGTSGTVVALDRFGAPIGNALMYNDAVDDISVVRSIAAVAPRESAAHGAASALARAIVLQSRPGVERIVHQADWIAETLADGPLATDESNALKTGYDPVARCWPNWLAKTPLKRELLPNVAMCGSLIGKATGAFGLPRAVPIVAGTTDGCASFLATGAETVGDGVTAIGTTLTLKLLCDHPVFAPDYGIYSHRVGTRWLAGGASNTGGGVLAHHFSPGQIELLSAEIDPETNSGLDYYPLIDAGERFPINDPALEPRMDPRPKSDAHFLHGLMEGIARVEALGYRRLSELGAPSLRRLRTVGGGATNPVWTAMRSRIVNVPMEPVVSVAAAHGVARLALQYLDARP